MSAGGRDSLLDPAAPQLDRQTSGRPLGDGDSTGGGMRLPGAEDELLTPGQAAKLIGVSAKTVSNWARDGRLPSFRTMGGHRRFRRSELERALSMWSKQDVG